MNSYQDKYYHVFEVLWTNTVTGQPMKRVYYSLQKERVEMVANQFFNSIRAGTHTCHPFPEYQAHPDIMYSTCDVDSFDFRYFQENYAEREPVNPY